MSAAIKKKTKQKTPSVVKKRKSVSATAEFEAPVLFRLPDVTEAASVGHKKAAISEKKLAAATPAIASEAPSRPRIDFAAVLSQIPVNKLVGLGRIVWNLPYSGPVGLLGTSLLLSVTLIYQPWPHSPSQAAKTEMGAETKATRQEEKPAIPAATVAESPKSPVTKPESKPNSPLKKYSTALEEQLIASEAPSNSAGDAKETEVAETKIEEGDFTEPSMRKKPFKDIEMVANAEDATEEPLDDSQENFEDDLEVVSPREAKRMAMRKPNREFEGDSFDGEEIESAPIRRRGGEPNRPTNRNRFDSSFAEEGDPTSMDEAGETSTSRSPWGRIRNERIEREPVRDEPIGDRFNERIEERPVARTPSRKAEKPSAESKAKPQYRSPPGQDFDEDFGSESSERAEPTSRFRDSQRTGAR